MRYAQNREVLLRHNNAPQTLTVAVCRAQRAVTCVFGLQRFKFACTPVRLLDVTVQRIVGQESTLAYMADKSGIFDVLLLNLLRGKPHFPQKTNAKLIQTHLCMWKTL